MPYAPTFPLAIELAPVDRVPDLASMDDRQRDGLAAALVDLLGRVDRLFDAPAPYMLWLNQRPTVADSVLDGVDDAWFNVEIVSPWRSPRTSRYIAAAELACEEYFNPVEPEALAARLRALA